MSDTFNIDYAVLAKQVVDEIKKDWADYKNLSGESKTAYEKAVNDLASLSVRLASAKPEDSNAIKKEIEIVKVTISSISAVSEMFLFRKTVNIIGGILGTAAKAALGTVSK